MIIADMKIPKVEINGDMVSVLDDFTSICRALRTTLTAAQDVEFADRTIDFCVELSRKPEEEMEKDAEAIDETDDTKSLN